MVDDKGHIQKMAASSLAGYVPMYNLVLEERNDYADFSGSQQIRNSRPIRIWKTWII